ncbi:MAG: AsmA family protein, partial [Bryobacterales bacterium]|nr:AsmA family protein [Bryobacterales bacterium]
MRFVLAFTLLVALAIALAPQIPAGRYRGRVEQSMERALQRNVEIGELRFSLWGGPGFTLSDVVISDAPEISPEPFAYVGEVRARIALASIWRGEMAFSRITLDQPSVNVAQGPDGGWNFEQMLQRGVGTSSRGDVALPELHVRNGRINFRSGLRKSIYYFRNADLQLAEESHGTGAWLLEFRAEPARTDSFAPRFGTVRGRGRWSPAAGKSGEMEADLEMERSPLAEVASLFRAPRAGLSGFLSVRAHLSGPVDALDIRGNLELSQRGDWGIFATAGDVARVPLSGFFNLPARRMHLEVSPTAGTTAEPGGKAPESSASEQAPAVSPPAFEATVDYNQESAPGEWLSRIVFGAMPVSQVTGLLQYLDDSFPDYPQLEGDLQGEVVYGSRGGLRGAVTADHLLWKPEPAFALRTLHLNLEGDRIEGGGLLDT